MNDYAINRIGCPASVRSWRREAHAAKAFGTALNGKALQIHLQRVTGAFVGSAFGAAQFYGTKKSAAMELTSKLLNDDRDEDRDGPSGFESKAERARLFAAEIRFGLACPQQVSGRNRRRQTGLARCDHRSWSRMIDHPACSAGDLPGHPSDLSVRRWGVVRRFRCPHCECWRTGPCGSGS
jgi:hypothetical protein